MSKKNKITQFYARDRNGFSAMSRAGHVPIELLKEKCYVTESRIKNWERDGYATRVPYKEGNSVKDSIRLTGKGERLAETQWGLRHHYNAQNPYHDNQIARKFFSVSPEQRDQWKTESEIRNQFFDKLDQLRDAGNEADAERYEGMYKEGFLSMPDCAYVNDHGVEVVFEVTSSSYDEKSLIAKEATAELLGYGYESSRI